MAAKSPLGKTASIAIKSIRHPVSTTGKIVEQAKGTVALGKMVTEHVGKAAASMAAETASSVIEKAGGRKPVGRRAATPSTPTHPPRAESPTTLRAVPDVNEPAHVPAENHPTAKKSTAKKATARKSPAKKTSTTATAKKSTAKKATAKKTTAKKSTAKKSPVKKTAAKKAPAKKTAERNSG